MPRLSISLDSDVLQALATRANVERRSASSMAALLIEGALAGREAVTAEPLVGGDSAREQGTASGLPPGPRPASVPDIPGVTKASELPRRVPFGVDPDTGEIVSERFEEAP